MGFLDSIIGIFSGGNDPETAKKKRLRQIVKDLSQNKYGKFYKAKSEELCPACAKFFYDVYKIISSAQVFLQNAAKSEQLKQIVVDFFLDKELKELRERLNAQTIEEQAKTTPVKDLSMAVKRDLSAFVAGFDSARVNGIDNCYSTIIAFVNFTGFDFFFLLKKFDSNVNERNFTYQPRFQPVRAADLGEELKDFMEYSASVEADQDWKTALGVLKLYKDGMDVVNTDHWAKVLRVLKDVSRSRIFELIIQHTLQDPLWQSIPRSSGERIADTVLDAKKAEIEGVLSRIQNDKRAAQIEQLAKGIFGSADVERLANYTNKGNEIFLKKNFDGFTKIAGVNYLKAFLLDFFKKEIRELCDLLLIRGQWTTKVLSQPVSDAFHELMGLSEQLMAFDDSLADKGEHGSRLKQALLKVDRDKGQGKYIRIILKTVNNTAQRMINTASADLVAIGRSFKTLLEDIQKKPSELITNWRELESASEEPLGKRITGDYKRIYYFVQLLQFFTGPVEEET
ncbi:MAG: DUF5312 domain-containing protein [Spirochaetaceae bacterium]|jgi:hypothetical protein|nr:DUF5312 domain-containing protein [Spirochaetaceae bacterium]